jgi:hypothetical protein
MSEEEGITTSEAETSTVLDEINGGKKKSNGHKMSCKCPICKNMMKKMNMMGGKKSRKHRKSRKSRKNRKSRKHRKH